MEVDRRGAGCIGTGVGADDSLAQQRFLESFVLEIALHKLDHGPLEEEAHRVAIPAEPGLDLCPARRRADPKVVASRGTERIAHPLLEVVHSVPAG
jgi:hypothetical protein